jgi:hypothetical protein
VRTSSGSLPQETTKERTPTVPPFLPCSNTVVITLIVVSLSSPNTTTGTAFGSLMACCIDYIVNCVLTVVLHCDTTPMRTVGTLATSRLLGVVHAGDITPNAWSFGRGGARVGIQVKTHDPPRPDTWQADKPREPDEVLALIKTGLLQAKSTGRLPGKVRNPTPEEMKALGWSASARVSEEWHLLDNQAAEASYSATRFTLKTFLYRPRSKCRPRPRSSFAPRPMRLRSTSSTRWCPSGQPHGWLRATTRWPAGHTRPSGEVSGVWVNNPPATWRGRRDLTPWPYPEINGLLVVVALVFIRRAAPTGPAAEAAGKDPAGVA